MRRDGCSYVRVDSLKFGPATRAAQIIRSNYLIRTASRTCCTDFCFSISLCWCSIDLIAAGSLCWRSALEAAWEVFENSSFVIDRYRTATAALGYQGDTVVNSIGDLACALIGFLIARQLGIRRSLILFVLVELILILWIHDSLLLQILMLVRPIEAIKSWQMCA